MIAVAMTMLVTVLPSAATMPMASTKSGKAMMVSAMRPTMRSVQPPKKPAAIPASPPTHEDQRDRERRRCARSSRVATTTRREMSRPSWSVPNQCRSEGACSAGGGVARQRVVGHERGAERARRGGARGSSAKAKPVTGFSATTWRACASVATSARRALRRRQRVLERLGRDRRSAPILTRGSMTP